MLYLQAQALNYHPLPGMPLIERDPVKVQQLAATSADYFISGGREALFNPACLMSLWRLQGAEMFRALPSTRSSSILVFIGECFSPDGKRYLVGLGLEWDTLTCGFTKPSRTPRLAVTVINPANWVLDANVWHVEHQLPTHRYAGFKLSSLHFAERDPSNRSHLTVRYEDDRKIVTDLWLRDDGTMQIAVNATD